MTSISKNGDADRQLNELLDLLNPPPAPSDVLRARLGQAFSRGGAKRTAMSGDRGGSPRLYRAAMVASLLALAVAGAIAMPPAPQHSAPVATAAAAQRPVEQDLEDLGLVASGPAQVTYRVALVGRSLGDSDANQTSDGGSLSYVPLE